MQVVWDLLRTPKGRLTTRTMQIVRVSWGTR